MNFTSFSLIFRFLGCLLAFQTSMAADKRMPTQDSPLQDPYLWLEEVESKASLDWVKEQNARTTGTLEKTPLYSTLQKELKNILLAKDRVPFAASKKGYMWNFWQDEQNKHGILRRTSLLEYKKEKPSWETILDFDALSARENENWVYKGNLRLDKDSSRALLFLSRGGKDAVVLREFDLDKKEFVTNGFEVPEAKSEIAAVNENELILGTDFGKDSMTQAGYPRTLKWWKRGTSLSSAQQVFEVQPTDIAAAVHVLKDNDHQHILFARQIDFYHQELFVWNAGKLQKTPLPNDVSFLGVQDDYLYASLREPLNLKSGQIPSNSIVRHPIKDFSLDKVELVFSANKDQSIDDVSLRKNEIYITLLDQVQGVVLQGKPNSTGPWTFTKLPFPSKGMLSLKVKDPIEGVDLTLLTVTSHLKPQSQYLVHEDGAGKISLELLKAEPSRFDAQGMQVEQRFATSKDGTKIPYFIVLPKGFQADGSTPTLLYGYGGFEVSLTPSYLATMGKTWLQRGGVYVEANIRGGGEFGPQWHQAALREKRQVAFNDFIAVAEDLIASKITSPRHLGIMGGSNGGLLMGAVMVQRPELFNAAVIQVPLLDMSRFHLLLAGASWIGEYGDPSNPEDLKFLMTYSPYHHVQENKKYPMPLFTTSTKDDRVHPAHARKMAAKMKQQGHPYYYYENTNGGHAGSANLEERIHMKSLECAYLWSRLK